MLHKETETNPVKRLLLVSKRFSDLVQFSKEGVDTERLLPLLAMILIQDLIPAWSVCQLSPDIVTNLIDAILMTDNTPIIT